MGRDQDLMVVRLLIPADAPDYRDITLEAYDRHPDAFTSSGFERRTLDAQWWVARLATTRNAQSTVFEMFEGAELAGVAGLCFQSRQKVRHKATLFGMYVRERFRRREVGVQLVDAVLEGARSKPEVTVVQLTVTQGNEAAHNPYLRCGFVPFGIEPYAVAAAEGYLSKVHMWRFVR